MQLMSFISQFASCHFDSFDFIPSVGASGGILNLWVSNAFTCSVLEKMHFSLTISFTSIHNGDIWHLTNDGPYNEPECSDFLTWFRNCEVDDSVN
jgi:hypothetical protein